MFVKDHRFKKQRHIQMDEVFWEIASLCMVGMFVTILNSSVVIPSLTLALSSGWWSLFLCSKSLDLAV